MRSCGLALALALALDGIGVGAVMGCGSTVPAVDIGGVVDSGSGNGDVLLAKSVALHASVWVDLSLDSIAVDGYPEATSRARANGAR